VLQCVAVCVCAYLIFSDATVDSNIVGTAQQREKAEACSVLQCVAVYQCVLQYVVVSRHGAAT